ncbi:hypothetical protein [Nannocystis radixulma]|uniref:Band 7 domain-containing protein n=1 Tax=Nannocystis radixulma TaxID=2995305 RepID=A0ABT5BF76_9BACT|nr:hypothetical protein [Nannocystis radixulma]MDC0672793.1 hypothetical protein [Nannocystis radixulma]
MLGWIGFVLAALCLTVLLAWVLALLGWFLWKSAGKESWRAFEAVAVALMIGILGCGLYLVVAAMARGLVWSLRRTWRFDGDDGLVFGEMAALAGRVFRGHGVWTFRCRDIAVEEDPPSASEVEAAGPAAVARELEAIVPATIFPRTIAFGATHVLVLAAALHLGAHGVVRYAIASDRRWRRTGRGPRVTRALEVAPDAAGKRSDEYIRVRRGEGEPPQEAIARLMLANVERFGALSAEREMSRGTGDSERADPYRGAPPAAASRATGHLSLFSSELCEELKRRRDALESATPGEAKALARRLAAGVYAHPRLALTLLEIGEGLQRAMEPPDPRVLDGLRIRHR